MSSSIATLTEVVGTLSEVCHSTSPKTRGKLLATLERFESCDNYVTSLIRIIDVCDVGETLSVDCRHLAAVLLKNVVGKRGKLNNQPLSCGAVDAYRPLNSEEKAVLKNFLVRYQQDPSCRVALQLSCTAAKLAKLDGDTWLQEWPELIPALVAAVQANYAANQAVLNGQQTENGVNSPSFIRSMRGITTLNEVLQELSQRASVITTVSPFYKSYSTLCAQLYPVISKIWGEDMKKLQQHLGKLNAQAATGDYGNSGTGVTGSSQAELESLLVHAVLVSKVLRILLEFGFEGICAAYPSFFKCFWKCYMGGLRILADFVRKHRPFCAELRRTSAYAAPACGCGGSVVSNLLVCMKAQVMADDDMDDMCDAYVPIELAGTNGNQADLLAFINLVLKLIKSLGCAPVILQRKYPLLVLPCLGCMLEYFHTLLVEEYGTIAAQAGELSVLQLSHGGGVAAGLTAEQKHSLYAAQLLRDALPLNYLVKATVMFLANVLSCGGYAECNMYARQPQPPVGEEGVSCTDTERMEEAPAVKADVASAHDLRKTFFSSERVTQLLRMLLYPMLTYCDKELAIWAACPEDFVLAQDTAAETFSVKSAAEKLFAGLVEFAPDTVCGLLCPMLMHCARQEVLLSPVPTLPCPLSRYLYNREMKLYDAVYMCTGLGVGYLGPYMSAQKRQHQELQGGCKGGRRHPGTETSPEDTPSTSPEGVAEEQEEGATLWVKCFLGPMVQQLLVDPTAGCLVPDQQQLLRARLVWLLSIWMHKLNASILPHVLKILTDIIGPTGNSDVVVKIQATQALQALINLEIFDIAQLKFHIVASVEALCLLVRQLDESDCKVTVLEVAGELISLLSVQMTALKPLVQPLAGYLESLWTETSESDPARNAILEVMRGLVTAAKHHSASILPVTTPLISTACDTRSNNDNAGGPPTIIRCLSELTSAKGDRGNGGRCYSGSGENHGFLVRDGVALWLAVVRNLTEQQYAAYHVELQQLFVAAMSGLGFGGDSQSKVASWDLLSDPACADITRDLLLVVEAYALLGGEDHCLLLDAACQGAVTALYRGILGKVEARQVRLVTRPLQALLLSCPEVTGRYFNDCGVLAQVLRICLTGVECCNLRQLFDAHKEPDLALTAYLSLIAQLLLFQPTALYAALTTIKTEVLAYVARTVGHADEKLLTETILIAELVNLMFRLHPSLASGPAPVFTAKLWSLALLSLLPPTILDNKPAIPPGAISSSGTKGTGGTAPPPQQQQHRPECILGRMVMMIMNTLQFTAGLAKLEEWQWEHCRASAAPAPSAAAVDYLSLCFWYPSTLTAEHLFRWAEPLVRVCKGPLQQERSRKGAAGLRRDLSALISVDGEDGAVAGLLGEESDCEDSDSECTDSADRSGSYDESMKASSDQDAGLVADAITAAEGDSQRLDAAPEPILLVHRARMEQSGLLTASIEAYLTQKFSQLCRTVGEQQFATLTCVAELGL